MRFEVTNFGIMALRDGSSWLNAAFSVCFKLLFLIISPALLITLLISFLVSYFIHTGESNLEWHFF
jgi:hypothetical protein